MTTWASLLALRRLDERSFAVEIPDHWQQGRGTFGGLVLALLSRAAEATVSHPARTLRSLTSELCGPTQPGPAEVRTEILRAGNAVSTVAARLVQGGEVQAHAVCVLGRTRSAQLAWSDPRPPLPDWRRTALTPIPPELMPVFTRHVEMRPTSGLPFAGARHDVSGFVRLREPPAAIDSAYLIVCADAYWPVALTTLTEPRPMATLAFTLELLASPEGLAPDEPLYHEARSPAADGGYLVELRTLRGGDGRVLALNQQTFVAI